MTTMNPTLSPAGSLMSPVICSLSSMNPPPSPTEKLSPIPGQESPSGGRAGLFRLLSLLLLLAVLLPQARAADTYLQSLATVSGVVIQDTAVGKDGSVYVLGNYSNPAGSPASDLKIGNTTLVRGWTGADAGFLAKLGPEGGWQWAIRLYGLSGTTNKTFASRALAVNANNIFVAGVAGGSVTVEDTAGQASVITTPTTTLGIAAPFVLKLDTKGKFIWGNSAKATPHPVYPRNSEATVNDIGIDTAGNVYLCGGIPNDSWVTFPGAQASPVLPLFGGGYLAKLSAAGAWQWVTAVSGNTFRNEFYALALDERDRVYVTGEMTGRPSDLFFYRNGTSATANTGASAASVAIIARFTPAGDWDSTAPWKWLTDSPYTSPHARGKALSVVNGKVYHAVEYESQLFVHGGKKLVTAAPSAGLNTDVAVLRWTGNLGDVDAVTQVSGVGQERSGRHFGSDSQDNIYLAGLFVEPQANFGTQTFSTPPEGTQDGPDVTTSKTNLFVAKLNRDLQWQWVQRARGLPPDAWSTPPIVSVDKRTSRTYLAGAFSGGTLALGSDLTPSSLTTDSVPNSYLTAIDTDGNFLQQVQLTVVSDYGGRDIFPALGKLTYLRGQSISASVPPILYEDALGNRIAGDDTDGISKRAVTRHTCLGYEVLDTAIAGSVANYGFVIDADTTVRFNWLTEYALDVTNKLTGLVGLSSQAAGNPDPVSQKHWIPAGTITTAFIDGIAPSSEANSFGTRFRSTGYAATGAVAPPGNALLFGGNPVELGIRPAYAPNSGPFTMEFWFRSDAVDIYSRRLVDWGNLAFVRQENGSPNPRLIFSSPATFTGDLTLDAGPMPTNVWRHLALVNDGKAWAIYLDGKLALAQPVTGALTSTTSTLKLGEFFAGAIEDFRLWRVARSQIEIQQSYRLPLANLADPNLIAYWPFDEAASGTVADLKDTSRTATVGTKNGATTGIVPARTTQFISWVGVQPRQQVPQFIMSGPATIEYRWVKENSVRVAASPSSLESLPIVVSGGVTNRGSGEYWFPENARVKIFAPQKPALPVGYQLNLRDGQFIGGYGNVPPGSGNGLVDATDTGLRYVEISALSQGSGLTWNYAQRVYQGSTVAIGNALDGTRNGANAVAGTFTGDPIPAAEGIDLGKPPTGTTIISNAPPGSTVQDMWIWDDVDKRLYPLRPGSVRLEWARQGGGDPVITEVSFTFPAESYFPHIANTPPVPLDEDKADSVAFVGMKYSERTTAVVNGAEEFSVSDDQFTAPFWSVLVFSQTTNQTAAQGDIKSERLLVRTVQTKRYSDGLITRDATIGTPLTSSAQSSLVPHNGYIYWEKARYNASIYNRSSRQGPIIPVNVFPTAKPEEKLVVVWYTQKDRLNWPAKAFAYNPAWPQDANRIVVASRLGSEGINLSSQPQTVFAPERYTDVQIYNQPDRNLPGYNPNEEHALVAPSLVNVATPTPAAFALRRDLNQTNQDDSYTSDPFVLVQYFDRQTTNYGMAAYQVQVQEPNVKTARLVFSANGTGSLNVSLSAGKVLEFNFTAGPYSQTGLQTNEVVDLEPNDNLPGLSGGRYRVSVLNSGTPAKFALVPLAGGPPLTVADIVPGENPTVVLTRAFPYVFDYGMKAGEPVLAPYPLQLVIGASSCAATRGENLDPAQLVYWEDHKKQPWAVSGSDSPTAGLRAQFYYPRPPEFWHPSRLAGDCVGFVTDSDPVWVTNRVTWPARVPVLKAGETLTFSGGEINRDDANRPGVPGVVGWAAGKVVFDQANPALAYTKTVTNYLARLASPLLTLEVSLPIGKLPAELQPASGNVTVSGTAWTFNKLDASLQPRVRYDQSNQKLSVRGFLDGKTLGDPALTAAPGSIYVLQPNILTENDRAALLKLVASPSADWTAAISSLVQLSRDPKQAAAGGYGVGLEPVPGTTGQARPAAQFGPGLALLPNQALLDPVANLAEGYVTLAENDDESLGSAPVALHIVRIRKQPLFRGAIKTINPPSPFDEKITLRHSADFGGNAADLDFEWYYRPDDGKTFPPPDTAPVGTWALFADPTGKQGRGLQEINLGGAGAVTLTDNRFFVRWKHRNSSVWSQWAGAANSRPPATGELAQNTYVPQLAEGWVKRVLAGINPFDSRITDFRNNGTPATYASMVQQAGAPYRGPVALNADKNIVENTGLLELYTTVIQRAKGLSIDLSSPISTPAVNNTILLAASRIADLQLLLGNEAYTDAQDPTIGFGSSSVEYGALAPTIFTFQNQVATLLDEELALLRGRSEEGAYPAYNRLLWNFTRAEGEAAYALSYNITDVNQDGFINEADARILYPQGHGDAWGNYLSALRTYYDLLRHPNYNWQARSENLQIEGVVVAVDYLDERKFAQAAAAKAKAGSEVVNLTYRSRYVEDPDGQWQGYQDTDPNRAWGVVDWARRAGTGALFDWITANAILPASNTNKTGIERVDRTTVAELAQISAQAVEIRKQLDNANTGLNPVGLATDVVPFDIDPIGFDPATGTRSMHFDQVYDRALKALQNALDVFNNANQLNHMLRQVAETTEQFAQNAAEQDLDFRNRLIEVFGTPYEGVIGPGKAYPAGYTGPDLYLYMYTDVTGIQNIPAPSTNFTAYFGQLEGGFVKAVGSNGAADTITKAWSSYFAGDAPSLEDNTNTDFSTKQLVLNLPQTASSYAFQAPAEWGSRRAPGEIQQILTEMVQAEADLQLALHDYDGLIGDLGDLKQLILAQSGVQAETVRIQQKGLDQTTSLNTALAIAQGAAAFANQSAELSGEVSEAQSEAIPGIVGLASDAFSAVRGAIKGVGAVLKSGARGVAAAAETTAAGLENRKEILQLQNDLSIQKAEFKYAMQEQLKEFESLLGDESAKRIEVFRKREALRQISDKYRAQLESGLRLLEERALHNRQSAGATQKNRYQDFTFRVARNDALSKYRAAFDLATRYVYLAAKAYDYETNLDPNDPASARPTLTQIMRARTLGALDNGEPRLGSGGLADALANLKVNFEVLRSQMGFNNPQGESGQFSLRHELFRMKGTNDVAWRQELEKYRVADLWQVPEFRRFCRPFAPQAAGTQPGMVIPFSSQIVFGKNFFGKPLGPKDSAYDPTLFATKVRSVGVWFDNYAGEGLGTTPRVYLVPAGIDIMYVPNSADFATREWNVVDQKIPIPLPVSQSNLRDPSWIPLRDSVNGNIAEIRRYSSFRAFHDAGFNPDQMSFDSRLVGRSVWNTRWLLIIPGGTFLADQTDGLDTFIYGLKSASGPATDSRGNRRDGNGVGDIKLSFQTYAISGN